MNNLTLQDNFQLIILTGLSGAGKTKALRYLEDFGYFCVDNFLPNLIVPLIDLISSKFKKVAIVIDARGGDFFSDLSGALHSVKEKGWDYKLIFLDSNDDILIKRFSETRRKHPLMKHEMTLLECIQKERNLLKDIYDQATYIIDTSNFLPTDLRRSLLSLFNQDENESNLMSISVISFGYRYGIPIDADLVFDVRFLPNPHYIDELRHLNGLDTKIQDFVLTKTVTQEFLKIFSDFVLYLIPHYKKEGKSSLTIAIGCTGGKHRSVAISHALCELLKKNNLDVIERHRDIEKS